jgi:hypothetical protein
MKKLLLLPFLICVLSLSSYAQTTDYKFQSLFIYNIAKMARWSLEHESGDFKIAVLGSKDIAATIIKSLEGKKIGNQEIKVTAYNSLDEAGYNQILFVPANTKISMDKLNKATENKNTMLVTERDGWGKKGSTINFVMIDGKMKFEVNTDAAQKVNVRLSNSISAMGIVL